MRFCSKQELVLACEIKNLLQKDVINEPQHEEAEFISPVLLELKSEDSFKIILKLKRMNENMP